MQPFREVFNLLEEFKEHCNPDEPASESKLAGAATSGASSAASLVKGAKPYDQLASSLMTVLVTKKGQDQGYQNIGAGADSRLRVKKFTSRASGLVMPMCHFVGQNIWILKPTTFNRGKGIHVVNSIAKLKKLIKEYSGGRETPFAVA